MVMVAYFSLDVISAVSFATENLTSFIQLTAKLSLTIIWLKNLF